MRTFPAQDVLHTARDIVFCEAERAHAQRAGCGGKTDQRGGVGLADVRTEAMQHGFVARLLHVHTEQPVGQPD